MIIALVYEEAEEALEDYHRAASWRYRADSTAQICVLHLEKDSDGTPWLDIGRRDYLRQGAQIRERGDEKIAVRVAEGGQNRMKVLMETKRADAAWLVFTEAPADDPVSQQQFLQMIFDGCVPVVPGTEPTLIRGLSTLGKLAQPQGRLLGIQAAYLEPTDAKGS